MPRLTPEQWELARATYEVRGSSLGEIARTFGVSDVAVGKRARKEGWIQGKSSELVAKKVAAIKELVAAEQESSDLPRTFRYTVDAIVRERLQADGLLASLDVAIASKAMGMAERAETAQELETLSKVRRNLTPTQTQQQTTVNVSQQQAAVAALSPREALAEIIRQADEDDNA